MKKILWIPVIIIILGGITGNTLRYTDKKPNKTVDFSIIPMVVEETYFGGEYEIDKITAEVLNATATTNRLYSTPDGVNYQLFVAYFESQKYGSQIHSPKHCLPGSGWDIEMTKQFDLSLPDGSKKGINYSIIRDKTKRILMLYWYETKFGSVSGEYRLKFDLLKNSILFNPTDAAIIRVIIDADNDLDLATEKGIEFIDYFNPYIMKSLPF